MVKIIRHALDALIISLDVITRLWTDAKDRRASLWIKFTFEKKKINKKREKSRQEDSHINRRTLLVYIFMFYAGLTRTIYTPRARAQYWTCENSLLLIASFGIGVMFYTRPGDVGMRARKIVSVKKYHPNSAAAPTANGQRKLWVNRRILIDRGVHLRTDGHTCCSIGWPAERNIIDA